ncbi:MAG: VWA domain-containing protein [Paludibacteraceae bacterium]|nr:VWA domain-containing protein [Paludibacteraceae bacterium]
MFRFAHIEYLWLLLLLPLITAAYLLVLRHKRHQLHEFGDENLVRQLMPNASRIRPNIKFSLLMVALMLLIFAIARPQFGTTERTVKRQGIEVMIALDISNSMMAEDVAPCRLDRAKQMLSRMIDKMVDDKVGLVVFAGESYIQLPITCDYVSAKTFLNSINPDLIKTQGTAIGDAIRTCMRAFGTQESDAGRAIIIITDGENHEDDAEAAAKLAHEAGIQVDVIGIGKPEGSPIPIPGTGNFLKDRDGQVVVSRLNEKMGQDIASAGHGLYVRCDNTNTALQALLRQLDDLATAELKTSSFKEYNEQYQSFALLALLLIIIDFFIFSRKNKTWQKFDIFKEKVNKN